MQIRADGVLGMGAEGVDPHERRGLRRRRRAGHAVKGRLQRFHRRGRAFFGETLADTPPTYAPTPAMGCRLQPRGSEVQEAFGETAVQKGKEGPH